jgi:hypothetical protein
MQWGARQAFESVEGTPVAVVDRGEVGKGGDDEDCGDGQRGVDGTGICVIGGAQLVLSIAFDLL